jgi:hypothetical protein
MGDCARRAQHYHDLALEFLVLTKIVTAIDIRENYRKMGRHYLAKARAELARAKKMLSTTGLEVGSVSARPRSVSRSILARNQAALSESVLPLHLSPPAEKVQGSAS